MGTAISTGLLEAQVAQILERYPKARAIGIHLGAPWSGGSTLRVNGRELPVAFCPSALAFRAELMDREGADTPFVLLTDRDDRDLGEDVLARLVKPKLFHLNDWQALADRLGVITIDPRLRSFKWLPGYLLALPEEGQVRPVAPVLDADEVWQALLARLGFDLPRPDLRGLLEWTESPERLEAFLRLPAEVREGHAERISMTAGAGAGAGSAGRAVLRMVEAGRGASAIPAGLVCELLFPEGGGLDAERARAHGRFEAQWLGGERLEPAAGRAWATAAAAIVRDRLEKDREKGISTWQEQARLLLVDLGLESLGERSAWLPAGYGRAVAGFAGAVSSWLERPDTDLSGLDRAAEQVRGHSLARSREEREEEVGAVDMMLRLARWLAARPALAPARSFAEAAERYVRDGSFADRARAALADASLTEPLAGVRARLLEAARNEREKESKRFAELLAGWAETADTTGPPRTLDGLIPIEQVLDRLVAPLAAARPVLLLVLDGLSFPIFRELAEDLPKRDWQEMGPQGSQEAPARLYGAGLLPTVTEFCRASLLCGSRRQGTAAAETAGFAEHPGLRRHTTVALPPVLFHKKHLGSGGGLDQDVRDEIARAERRVVGLVLNVVDDQLPKGRQLMPRWEVAALRFLREILQAAEEAGRAVVLAADHGHVVERGSELRRHDGGGVRYRPLGPPPGEGEVAVRGPRVLAGGGAGLVLAWSERLRYSTLQSGYHGGASPQEVLVPLSVWVPFDSAIPGWARLGADKPAWWDGAAPRPEPAPAVPPVQPPVPPPIRPPRTVEAQGVLFAERSPAVPDVPKPADWLAALFASPTYREQRNRAGRQGLTDDTVAGVLRALDGRGGRMTLTALAHQLGYPPGRVPGLVAAIQRVLNVEGFPVLALGPDLETVVLDRALLATQFPPAEESP